MIEARGISVSIGAKPIVRNASFRALAGQFTVIVGPNGSGKTTLLKAISGDLAYRGSASLNGDEVSAMRPAAQARLRAVLPQATTLSFPFTVREIVNLGLVGGLSGVAASQVSDLVERALARVDLSGFAGRFYQELSGGEQQRVQLARVLCQVWTPVVDGAPRWLLLDEPVSSLDIRHQLAILATARDFARAGGGVIAILHDLNLAAMFGDQIIAMRDGEIRHSGTASDVMDDAKLAGIFGCNLRVGQLPVDGAPFVLPQSAG